MNREISPVYIGDIARHKVTTPKGSVDEIMGSGFCCAMAASTIAEPGTFGTVARVGLDLNLNPLRQRRINLDGVAVVNDRSTLLTIVERANGTRDHSVKHGAAGIVDVSIFPQSYKGARYVHLATFEPHRQLQWVNFLKQTMPDAKLSADTLEQDIQYTPEIVEKVLSSVDLVFINEGELALLKRSRSQMAFDIPMVVKKGAGGAEYIHGEININVPAPKVEVVDTTGAGEVLAAIFVLLQNKGEDIKTALTEGVHLASRVVTDMGVAHIAPLNLDKT